MAKKSGSKGKKKRRDSSATPTTQQALNLPVNVDPTVILLAFLLLCGALLRFYHLDFNSLWLDEASTLTFARRTLSGIWECTLGGEFNPPLFYWLEHLMLVFGDSEFVLRFLPALSGLLTIPVTYWAGTAFGDRNTGLIAAALMTFSPFAVYYSQDARAYAVVLLFFSIFLLFYGLARRKNDIRHWALAGVFAALAFWTHFYVLIPVVIIYLYALIEQGRSQGWELRKLRNFAISAGLFLLISLPLLVTAIKLFAIRTSSAPTYGIQGPGVITETIIQISGYNPLVAALFLILFFAGIAALYRDNREVAFLWIILFFAPLVISWLLSSSMPMIPRYLIYLLPVYFIGIASSYRLLYSAIRTDRVVYIFMIVFILVSLPFFTTYYTTIQKNDWRGLSTIIAETTSPGDVIVVAPGYMKQPLNYYYDNSSDGTIEESASSAGAFERITEKYPDRKLYFIVTGDIMAADPSGGAIDWLQSNTEFLGRHTGIYVFTINRS